MFFETQFILIASAVLAIELAVLTLLYYMSRLKLRAEAADLAPKNGGVIRKAMSAALPVLIMVTTIGDAAGMKLWADLSQAQLDRDKLTADYATVVKAALSAKPTLLCTQNGYLAPEGVLPAGYKSCAQVGQFRILDQYISLSNMVEIYKVGVDGSVKPAAYTARWDDGFKAVDGVTTLQELRQGFNVK